MTRRRWIADQVKGDLAYLRGQNAQHLARVLRAKLGQEFDIVCDGVVRSGLVQSVEDQLVIFHLGNEVAQAPFARDITLLLAVFKFDRMEWAIEKATELGVAFIHPVIARRTDAHLASAARKRVERWRRIAHEASQQSRRTAEPVIAEPAKLKDALTFNGAKIVLAESEGELNFVSALGQSDGPLALAVGPEGGWTADELQQFRVAGWVSVTLGPTILRAETAAIAALSIAAAFPQKS